MISGFGALNFITQSKVRKDVGMKVWFIAGGFLFTCGKMICFPFFRVSDF